MGKDYYKILGVPKDADEDTLKKGELTLSLLFLSLPIADRVYTSLHALQHTRKRR